MTLAILLIAHVANGDTLADRVRSEFLFSWQAYEKYAWGHDELRPISKTPRDWYGQSLLMTPIDSLDTLILMGFNDEADKARKLIDEKLSFDRDISVQNFEITIRLLGGLLSSYELTHDQKLLQLADDLGTRLLPVFNSPTGMPYRFVNLRTGKTSGSKSNPAEIGTLILEFGALSKLTHKPVYFDKAKNALVQLYNRRSKIGLVGEEIDVDSGQWISRTSHVGGGIDSYYEYLLKCARLFGDRDCQSMWRTSIDAVNKYVADGAWYGEVNMDSGKITKPEFGALHAFLPAVLALAGDMPRAQRLEASCFKMWTLAGIEPEAINYRTMKVTAAAYPLRPEIIESAYYLHHYTHDPQYIAMGRTFFDALVKNCRTDAGYTTLKSVETMEKGDLMPSYFLAETLKYFYLLFSNDNSVDRVIFNTEAHPLQKVEVVVDRNVGEAETPQFKFKSVPSPVRDDAAAKATVTLIAGALDGNSAALAALTDGELPSNDDQPAKNVFFGFSSWGGRVRMDFGAKIDIAQINSYSWHPDSRAPQVYKVFAADGSEPNFNPEPSTKLDPATRGWKLIAFVDTRDPEDEGGQYGVSIRDFSGTLGAFRYLLFDFFEAENDDPWGNTFYSEIDVIQR